MPGDRSTKQDVNKPSVAQALREWGGSPLPPTVTATLVAAQHMRPFQALPMLFPPVLLLASYVNHTGHKKDAAGMTVAWSGLYVLLARRRKQILYSKLSTRGIIHGATLAMCAANLLGGGLAYTFGNREEGDHPRS